MTTSFEMAGRSTTSRSSWIDQPWMCCPAWIRRACCGRLGVVPIGVYAGSFDPLHVGHVGVIEDASRWLDHLYVVVAGNPAKGTGLLPIDERRRLVAASVGHIANVEAESHNGLIVDFAATAGAEILIRASGRERDQEWAMSETNLRLAGIETVFVSPRSATRGVSSRWIRETVRACGPGAVIEFVPAPVADALAAL